MNSMRIKFKKKMPGKSWRHAFFVLNLALCILHAKFSYALTPDQIFQVQSQPRSESIIAEAYLDPARSEPILLVGGQFDRFLNEHIYIGGTIVGAISGGVGGYGLGALTLGQRWPLMPGLAIDTRLNIGGAGGGGVPAGGGLLVEPLVGFAWQCLPSIDLKVEAGFIRFLTSGYQPWVINTGIDFGFQHLFIPMTSGN